MSLENVKVAVYEKLHKQPYGTEEVVGIHRIIVPDSFKTRESRPCKKKMIQHRQEYHTKGFLDKPIEVKVKINKNGYLELHLVDKYCRLCIAFENGLENVPIKYIV